MKTLFQQDLKVVNVGLQGFADNIGAAGGSATQLSLGAARRGRRGARLDAGEPGRRSAIEEANRTAYDRYLAAQPRLVDLVLARDAIAGTGRGERRILHSGPPIAWADMCGPQQGAIAGAILYEGWADDARGRRAAGRRRCGGSGPVP